MVDTTADGGTEDTKPPRVERIPVLPDSDGKFSGVITQVETIAGDILKVVVSASVGGPLRTLEVVLDRTATSLHFSIDGIVVPDLDLSELKVSGKPPTRRVTGLVIDLQGKPIPAGRQVTLIASQSARQPAEKGTAILVAKTDRNGYFSGAVPNTEFRDVGVAVAGIPNLFPVKLENSTVPDKIPVVVEMPTPPSVEEEEPCNCSGDETPRLPTQEDIVNSPGTYSADLGTGKCIRFNRPNRAIEEYNFYSVIRTTEPEILAKTLDPPRNLPIEEPVVPVVTVDNVRPSVRPNVAATVIEASIRAAIAAATYPGFELTWPRLEQAIRSGVVDVGGIPLPDTFFRQFAGWGVGTVWSEGGGVFALILNSSNNLRAVIESAGRLAATDGQTTGGSTGLVVLRSAATADTSRSANRMSVDKAALRNLRDLYQIRNLMRQPGRVDLDASVPVDWDSTPTFYEATTIAHGHLLHYKQTWYADGYSLGDLLYSLPLAPGQKKLIAVIDWERREENIREESATANESLNALLSRDRDITEVVSGSLTESVRGGSSSTTAGIGAGTGGAGSGTYYGFNYGALLGVSGGYGQADANAWQDSSRTLSSNSLQSLRDRTLQSASAVRGQRSTVVQTARQGETVRATTEVVANHNHCHAMTIQYFEVLRHLQIEHKVVDVQECLFVPMPMMQFDLLMLLRWRESLLPYLKRPDLAPGFDAARRVQTKWAETQTPLARYGDEIVQQVFGELTLTVLIPLPPIPEKPPRDPADTIEETRKKIQDSVMPTSGPLGVILGIFTGGASVVTGLAADAAASAARAAANGAQALAESLQNEPTAAERYERFQREIMPAAAAGFVDQLELYALVDINGSQDEIRLQGADFTLVSEYQPGMPLLVSVRGRLGTAFIRRSDISALIVKSSTPLPIGCRAIVNSAKLKYQTGTFRHSLFDDDRVNDDIDLPIVAFTGLLPTPPGSGVPLPPLPPLPPGFPNWNPIPNMTPLKGGSGAILYSSLDEWEQRSPRLEDQRLANELLDHLNDNLEYYHHAIWWTMDPNRRYMLLDAYKAPNAGGRSVSSVVENKLIGIVGNSLIMPVAAGNSLDPRIRIPKGKKLIDFYDRKESPVPPTRVSLPTRGVFAEAVLGDCNACETIDDTRLWRWDESPIDEPPAVDPSAIASRRSEPNFGQPTPFPAPIVAIQNAPNAPDPTGLRAALDALGKQSFADITGLAATQANAAAAYSKALDTALAFGKEASTLAQQAAMVNSKDKVFDTIDKAKKSGKINDADESRHTNDLLDRLTMTPPPLVEAPSEWNPWPGDVAPPPPPPPRKTGQKPVPKTSDIVDVRIKLRAFVPAPIWVGNFQDTFSFNGDNRPAFHPTNGTHRAAAEVLLRIERTTFTLVEQNVKEPEFGNAEMHLSLRTDVVANRPPWWRTKSDPNNAPLLGPRRLDDRNALLVAVDPQPQSILVSFVLNGRPYFPFEIPDLQGLEANFFAEAAKFVLWPTMNANLGVRIINNGKGSIMYTINGEHDLFPSFELYVNEDQPLAYDSTTVNWPDSGMRQSRTVIPDPIFRPLKVLATQAP